MKILTTPEKALVGYYALYHNQVLLIESEKQNPTEESKSKARFVLFYSSVNPQPLIARPQIIDCLYEEVIKKTQEKSKLEMFHFYDNNNNKLSIESLSEYLVKLTDKKLKERIEEALNTLEECYICMDEKSDQILKCGHKMCETCIKQLPKHACPFCRVKFEAYHPINKEVEKKEFKVQKEVWKYVESSEIPSFLETRLKTLLSSTSQITPKNQEEFQKIFDFDPVLVMKVFQTCKIPSEETRAIVLGKFSLLCFAPTTGFKDNENSDAFKSFAGKFLNNPNRLLRFLAYLKEGEPKVDTKILLKMRKPFRLWIVSVIDSWKLDGSSCEQFQQHEIIWKRLFEYLHIGTYKKFENCQEIVKCVRTSTYPVKSTLGELEHNFKQQKGLEILSIFKKNPGLFFRNANRFCNTFPDVDKEIFVTIVEKILPTMRMEQLVELSHVLDNQATTFDNLSFVTKFGTMKWLDKKPQEKNKLHKVLLKEIRRSLLKVLEKNKLENVELCVIDDSMSNYRIKKGPAQKPAKFCTKAPSTRGDSIDFSIYPEETEFVLYNSWKHTTSIFLDLTAFGIDSNFKAEDIQSTLSDFSNTYGFNGTVFHSGDVYENGALLTSQYIRFNLRELKKKMPNVAYLVFANLSYSGVAFDEMEEGSVGIGYIGEKSGSGPYKSTVIDACNLRGNAKLNLGAVLDIKNQKFTFMNINIKSAKKGTITVTGNHGLLSDVVKHFTHWISTPSSPIDWSKVATWSATPYNKIILKSKDEIIYFEKQKDESAKSFLKRIQKKEGNKLPEKYEKMLKGETMKEENEEVEIKEEPIWLYYGNADFSTIELPSKSIVVTPEKISVESTVVHVDDPYKIFYLKQ